MRTWRLRSLARATCFVVALALAAHMLVAVGVRTTRAAHASRPCPNETVVRSRGLVTLGGYELNVTFTTEGRLVCFDITDANAKPAAPPA